MCLFSGIFGVDVYASQPRPTREINVVYDDSGSMYAKGVDTWCQAKYAMEVFSAMLGSTDTMNVYYMSDYEDGTDAGPRIRLDGNDGQEVNVSKIHGQATHALNTPFNSVIKAYSDLQTSSADEKWLVILTDGEFEDGKLSKGEIDAYLAQKDADISVMFLGMGPKAAGITNKPDQDIFYVGAQTNSEILNHITDICTRIFNSNKLEVNTSSRSFSVDVPMGEFVVFAQGANVELNGIKSETGKVYYSSMTPVEVRYSECDADNYNNPPTTALLGKIATYEGDFDMGNYIADVSGAETIEIYYKPNVDVSAYLTNQNGVEVEDVLNIPEGEYTMTFGFVKAGTSEKVPDSKLLGNIEYSAIVTNNGVTHDRIYSNGDKITLQEGTFDIDVLAGYLDYNAVSSSLSYGVFRDKEVTFSVVSDPQYTVISKMFEKDDPIVIKAQFDGSDFPSEKWSQMEIPTLTLVDESRDFKIDLSPLEKSDKPGEFSFKPVFPNGKPSVGTYKDVRYTIDYKQMVGAETWSGYIDGTVKIQDTRSWWERNWDEFVKLVIGGAALFVLLGFMPWFKHYLPKSLKKRPYIKCVPSEPGEKRKDRYGSVEKNILSTIIPYVPQKAIIKYVPKSTLGCPALAVRAAKRRRMVITNIKAFAGKDYITFDGESIKKDVKKYETGAGVGIRVKKGGWTYTCSPNQTK